jgi:initiation factor 1A
MPRNTQGGKNFKKFKTGAEGFRAKASREAAEDMLDLFIKQTRTPEKLTKEDDEALKFMVIGRVVRKFGNARVEAYCHDGKTRQCKIRGLLRKKGQVFIDNDSIVVISLREAESSSDDEMEQGGNPVGTSDIIGCFDDRQMALLRKTSINPRLFQSDKTSESAQLEDMFDRSDIINAGKNTIEEAGSDLDIDDV